MNKFETTRFGELHLKDSEIKNFRDGILGFESLKEWTIVDPCDSTKILWFQSLKEPSLAFPILPAQCLNSKVSEEAYYILCIPSDIRDMTANTKAPLVINGTEGEQVVGSEGTVKIEVYSKLKKLCMS